MGGGRTLFTTGNVPFSDDGHSEGEDIDSWIERTSNGRAAADQLIDNHQGTHYSNQQGGQHSWSRNRRSESHDSERLDITRTGQRRRDNASDTVPTPMDAIPVESHRLGNQVLQERQDGSEATVANANAPLATEYLLPRRGVPRPHCKQPAAPGGRYGCSAEPPPCGREIRSSRPTHTSLAAPVRLPPKQTRAVAADTSHQSRLRGAPMPPTVGKGIPQTDSGNATYTGGTVSAYSSDDGFDA